MREKGLAAQGAFVSGHLLGVFKQPIILEIDGDADSRIFCRSVSYVTPATAPRPYSPGIRRGDTPPNPKSPVRSQSPGSPPCRGLPFRGQGRARPPRRGGERPTNLTKPNFATPRLVTGAGKRRHPADLIDNDDSARDREHHAPNERRDRHGGDNDDRRLINRSDYNAAGAGKHHDHLADRYVAEHDLSLTECKKRKGGKMPPSDGSLIIDRAACRRRGFCSLSPEGP